MSSRLVFRYRSLTSQPWLFRNLLPLRTPRIVPEAAALLSASHPKLKAARTVWTQSPSPYSRAEMVEAPFSQTPLRSRMSWPPYLQYLSLVSLRVARDQLGGRFHPLRFELL